MTRLSAAGSLLGMAVLIGLGLSVMPAQAARPLAVTETPTATAPAPPSATATPEATPFPGLVDPLITKRVSLDRAVIGDRADYTLEVTNPNEAALLNVTVTDPLPAQVDFINCSTTSGALMYAAAAHMVTVVIGQLDAHQTVTIQIQTRVNANGQAPTVILNSARLSYSNGIGQGFTLVSASAQTQIIPGRLPASGEGPGPLGPVLRWGLVILAGLSGLGLTRWAIGRRR